jgi:NitT/TauT family transport system permease protein
MTTARTLTLGFRLRRWLAGRLNLNLALGIASVTLFFLFWQFARDLRVPLVQNLPRPTEVLDSSFDLLTAPQYWQAWHVTFRRIGLGFLIAQFVGIPLGLGMALNRWTFDTSFPILEVLRPIPPVAWIPIAIVFWPTREMSVVFIVFLGAFWIVLLNTIGGASTIDVAYRRAALSLGSRPRDVFWRIIFPATLPSIFTGMAVGMGISWEMVVASEMIAGQTGLGYLLWASFEINAIAQVILCMVSIGIAGYISSAIVRAIGDLAMPWRRLF